jgi:hypothetical protein
MAMPRDPNRFQSYIDEMAHIDPDAPPWVGLAQGSRPRMDRSGELTDMRSNSLDFRVHKYQIQKSIPDMMRQSSTSSVDLKQMAMRAMAGAIGDMIVTRVADITAREDVYRNELVYTAEFYAIPPQAIKELYGETLHVPSNTQPPPVVRETTRRVEVEKKVLPMEYATDELVNIYSEAYDIALMNAADDISPEKRGLDAVLEHLRSKM